MNPTNSQPLPTSRVQQVIQDLEKNVIPDDFENMYDEYASNETQQDNPYVQKQADVTIIREFSKTPEFDPKIQERFKGMLSPGHSNTFYKDQDEAILRHTFELARIYDQFDTPPKNLTFKKQAEIVNLQAHFFSSIKQSIGHTTERKNNRSLLAGHVSPLPSEHVQRKGGFKLFGLGGEQ